MQKVLLFQRLAHVAILNKMLHEVKQKVCDFSVQSQTNKMNMLQVDYLIIQYEQTQRVS